MCREIKQESPSNSIGVHSQFAPSVFQNWRVLIVFIVAHGFAGNLSSSRYESAQDVETVIVAVTSFILSGGFWSAKVLLTTGALSVLGQCFLVAGVTVAGLVVLFLGMMLLVSSKELQHLKEATPIAMNYLNDGMKGGLIQQKDGYHLYLPSSGSCEVVLVMVPGALVHHAAYARIAGGLSESGPIAVVVLHTDYPSLRHPCVIHGSGATGTFERIRNEITNTNTTTEPLRWAVVGHSMGAGPAIRIFRELPWVRQLITWGSYRELHSHNIGADCGKLLVVGASNDGFYFKSEDAKSDFMKGIEGQFQKDFIYHEVKGGNHSGFADYTAQTFPVLDGPREMPLEQQHEEVIGVTSDFLLKPTTSKEGEQKLIS